MASKSVRIDVSKLLPDDNEIVSQNVLFRKLLSKYSDKDKNKDELGLPMDEALKQYRSDDDEDSSLASDVLSDNDAIESDSSYDYKDAQKQLTLAVQERSEQWKNNGLDKILNDVSFKLSTTFVEDWLKQQYPNSNKQMAMDRERRVTSHDGDSTMDLTQKSNLTIQNRPNQQCISAMNSSNYEVSGSKKKIVIHQVEKTTLTTVATIFGEGTNGATLSLGSFSGIDLQGLSSFEDFKGFKIPNPVSELKYLSMKEPNPKASDGKDVVHANNAVCKGNTINRSISIEQKDGKQSTNKPRRVMQKPPKKMTSKTALNDSDDEENKPLVKHHETHTQSVCKPSRVVRNLPKKMTSKGALDDEENPLKTVKHHETNKKPTGRSRRLRISSSSDESVRKVQFPANQRKLVNGTNDQNILKSSKSKSKASECAPSTLRSKNKTVANSTKSVANEETNESIVLSSSSKVSHQPSCDLKTAETQPKLQSDVRKGVLPETPEVSVQSEKYIMSLDCQKRLTVGGHCRYNIEGTVIYRPRRIQANLPKDAKKIEITKQDLDLSAVASESKRKKFENFKRRIHPNSTVVYYMSDSEADEKEDDEQSDEDDDPLASFHPFVVFEYAYHGV
uniref:Uncharacterized protein n=1 Tax=Anopheles atroparvus TaxID=41427 RepID=A0AAG5D9X0_ANOAO